MTDLPPGRELDALVAEKVMGWPELIPGKPFPKGKSFYLSDQHCCTREVGDHNTWSPSTDWRAAGEVLEKLAEVGHRAEIRDWRHVDAGWECVIYRAGAVGPVCTGTGEFAQTGPHAICLAALAAVAVDSVP